MLQLFVLTLVGSTFSNVVPPECADQCATGISGIEGISSLLNHHINDHGTAEACKHYAASVVAADTLKACGYSTLADAIEECAFGIPPKHCFRHKNAGVAVVVVSHIAAIAVWFPIAGMIAKLN